MEYSADASGLSSRLPIFEFSLRGIPLLSLFHKPEDACLVLSHCEFAISGPLDVFRHHVYGSAINPFSTLRLLRAYNRREVEITATNACAPRFLLLAHLRLSEYVDSTRLGARHSPKFLLVLIFCDACF